MIAPWGPKGQRSPEVPEVLPVSSPLYEISSWTPCCFSPACDGNLFVVPAQPQSDSNQLMTLNFIVCEWFLPTSNQWVKDLGSVHSVDVSGPSRPLVYIYTHLEGVTDDDMVMVDHKTEL